MDCVVLVLQLLVLDPRYEITDISILLDKILSINPL